MPPARRLSDYCAVVLSTRWIRAPAFETRMGSSSGLALRAAGGDGHHGGTKDLLTHAVALLVHLRYRFVRERFHPAPWLPPAPRAHRTASPSGSIISTPCFANTVIELVVDGLHAAKQSLFAVFLGVVDRTLEIVEYRDSRSSMSFSVARIFSSSRCSVVRLR